MIDRRTLVYAVDDDASAREGLGGLIRSTGVITKTLRQGRTSWLRLARNGPVAWSPISISPVSVGSTSNGSLRNREFRCQ